MIRCEKCGHKLKDDQKICDICNTPVLKTTEDFDFEEELAKSIATIVENETTEARVYVREKDGFNQRDVLGVSQRATTGQSRSGQPGPTTRNGQSGQPTRNGQSGQPSRSNQSGQATRNSKSSIQTRNAQTTNQTKKSQVNQSSKSSSKKKKKKSHKGAKISAIVISILIVIGLIIGLAFYTINYFFTKTRDNFTYYNNTGITYVKEGKYQEAIPYLQKAISYDEAINNVNLRFSLYDCYVATSNTEMAMSTLYSILEIDKYNLEAIVSLENYYEKAGATEALIELYDKYNNTSASAAVSKYYVESPSIEIRGGDYTTDMDVTVKSDYGFDIYYTLDGTTPTTSSYKYSGPISIKEGTTTITCIAVNPYRITSNEVAETYTISYEAPNSASISPKSGNYKTEQMIVIGNIPAGGSAYYTTDGSKPTQSSTKYTGPFAMQEGNYILSVVVYDKNGLASDVSQRNYVLTIENKITQEEAEALVWNALIYHHVVNEEHIDGEGEPVSAKCTGKIDIEGMTMWAYELIVSTEQGDMTANYKIGIDAETGFVYMIYEENGVYRLEQVKF